MTSTTCCACAVTFEGCDNSCTICKKAFCTSCCALKTKLEMTAPQRRRKSCVCQQLIKMNGTDVDQGFPYKAENTGIAPHETSKVNGTIHDLNDSVIHSVKHENKMTSNELSQHKERIDMEKPLAARPTDVFGVLQEKFTSNALENGNVASDSTVGYGKFESESTSHNDKFNMEQGKFAPQTIWKNRNIASPSTLETRKLETGKFESESSLENASMISHKSETTVSRTEQAFADGSTEEGASSERVNYDDLVAHNLIELSRTNIPRGHQAQIRNKHRRFVNRNDEPLHELERDMFSNYDLDADDIPALGDIPNALILCNAFNETELQIAKEKERQKIFLSEIEKNKSHSNYGGTYDSNNHEFDEFYDERDEFHSSLSLAQNLDTPSQQQVTSKFQPHEHFELDIDDINQIEIHDKTGTIPKDTAKVQCAINKNAKSSDVSESQSEIREKRIRRLEELAYKDDSAYLLKSTTQGADRGLNKSTEAKSNTDDTSSKSGKNSTLVPVRSKSEACTTSNEIDTNCKAQLWPKPSSALDSNMNFSREPNNVLKPVRNGKIKNKNDRLSSTDHNALACSKETNPEVEYRTDTLKSIRPSKLVSETNTSGELRDTDDEDDVEGLVDDADLPTAMKALWISQGNKHCNKKANNNMLVVIMTDEKKGRNGRIPRLSDAVKQPIEADQAINKEGKQEFMIKAEKEVSEISAAYARAFDGLRKMQSSKKIKCIACSNPDCLGDFVQSIQGLMHEARKQGLVVNDVVPDGNCMFTAVCDQLQTHNDCTYTARTLREMAVFWLQENPYCSDDSKTHFQAFMEENWEAYLQRMIKDGEWGDHVVLRAVANITGCIIKILNVHGKSCTWTTLEPSEKQDGIGEIILGLVGESHYSSLRRTGMAVEDPSSETNDQSGMSSDKFEMSEEDRTVVALFMRDHVDSSSKMPVCSLSFLITRLFPIKSVMIEAAENSFNSLQSWTEVAISSIKNSHRYTPMISGCIGYGVYHPDLCYNPANYSAMYRMLDLNIFYICNLGDQLDRYILTGHGTLCCVGYTHLHYSKEYVRNSSYNAYNFVLPTRDGGQVSAVYVIHWPFWPQEASEWISRVRYAAWPSEVVIHDTCSKGCHLIPEAHENSADPDIEWKFCFVDAVTNLFQNAMSTHQKYCFLIVFGMCFEGFNHLEVFSLDWLINPFLYCCERCPSEFWQSHPASCVMLIIDNMMLSFKSRFLPSYFIPSWNLIETLNDDNVKLVMEILGNLRSEPLLVFRQMSDNFNVFPETEAAFEKLCEDAQKFESTKLTTLNTLIPCMIDIAKRSIKGAQYTTALEVLNEAFQARLSAATCEDAMSYENFIQGCFSGLNTFETAWFSTFVDKQLQSQLSRPLIRLVLDDRALKRIDEILDKDVAGFYGSSEVPESLAYQFDNFCRDYAAFLVYVNKVSDALPVLYRCHKRYLEYLSGKGDTYFYDETMLEVYAGIFVLYKRQQQTAVFKDILDDACSTVNRVNQPRGYGWLAYVYHMLKDENGEKTYTAKKEELHRHRTAGSVSGTDEFSLIHWPMKLLVFTSARGK